MIDHANSRSLDNPNPETLTKNGKAAAHVLAILAKDGKKLIPKWTPTDAGSKIQWTKREGERHTHAEGGCGDEL